MALVIKKRVNFDYLGEDYKDAYLEFRAIPIAELNDLQKSLPQDENQESDVYIKAMLNMVKKYFIKGKFPDEQGVLSDVVTDDLDNLDSESLMKTFQELTGVDANLEQPLTTTSQQ